MDRTPFVACLGSGPALYLKCDITYGLRAGGSLGHIGNVVRGLEQAGLEPIIAAVDRPATIAESAPMIVLDPGPTQWLHSERTMLAFNRAIVQQVARAWSREPPRFVYQRHALGAYAGLMIARRFGVPLVLEYNGPETWVARHWGAGLKDEQLLTTCENVVLRRADLVVTVSDVLTRELLERGLDAKRIVTVPNGVDLDLFHPGRDVARLRRSLALEGKTVIGFIGTFGPWHGVEILVQAFASVLRAAPDLRSMVRLLLVGEGSRSAAVRQLVRQLELHEVVTSVGLVPQSHGPDYVALFDIAVAPTVPNPDATPFFGSPTKIFEYMGAGRAIVASALGQVREVLRDGETALLVPGGQPEALGNALLRLIRDGNLRARLGQEARREAERSHGYVARAALLLRAIKGLGEIDARVDRTG
ncbi:MAG: glycosyltransferase family 4 protein [Hyphomicrobiaceae bacterium]